MFSKRLWPGAALGLFLLVPLPVHGQTTDKPALLSVNGQAANHYPVSSTSLPSFEVPRDTAAQVFVVNTPVQLAVNTQVLSLSADALATYQCTWNFGDGSTGTGLSLSHTYTTAGNKFITVIGPDSTTLDTLVITIAPTKNYTLPQPVIAVNGMTVTGTITAAFTRKIRLDASHSVAGSSPISGYTWNLGNNRIATDGKVTTQYRNSLSTITPIVRITDKNGIYVDTPITLTNATLPGDQTDDAGGTAGHRALWVVLAACITVGGASTVVLLRRLAIQRQSDNEH